MPDKTIFIIDAHSCLHRSFHAIRNLSNSKGEDTGALYGFSRMLTGLIENKTPDYMAVCFDSPGKTFRNKIFTEYKANRKETDPALKNQLNIARDLTKAFGLKPLYLAGYEADDIISTVVKKISKKNIKAVIVTSDKDVAQLVSENVNVWDAQKPNYSDEAAILKKFGVKPDKILDYLSLIGDSSDNIPGVKGIGPKGALKLLSQYGSFDKIMAAAGDSLISGDKLLDKVRLSLDDAVLSKKLIRLDDNVPLEISIDDFALKAPGKDILNKMAERLEFKELISKAVSLNALAKDIKAPGLCSLPDIIKAEKELAVLAEDGYISIGYGDRAFVKKISHLSGLEKQDIFSIIANEKIFKVFYNLKKTMHLTEFPYPSLKPRNFSDIIIAYHLINPSDRRADLSRMLPAEFIMASNFSDAFKRTAVLLNPLLEFDKKLDAEIKDKGLKPLYNDIELPLIGMIYSMEKSGIKIDKALLEDLSAELASKIEKLQKEIFDLSGHEINLNSPKQLSELIYNKLNISLDEKNKKIYTTKTGYSTAEEALLTIVDSHPAIPKILEYRELSKLKSSFVDNLLRIIGPGSRIHTTYEQDGTATGRFSSSKPNLQNIPVRSDYGAKIRRAFKAEEGFCLVAADYSQIDLRVLAHLSGDKNLTESFIKNEDIHKRTAGEVFKVGEKEVTAEMRRLAKAINFGIVYGQTAYGLARQLNIKADEAQKYIDYYFEIYQGVKKWIDSTIAFAKEKGFVSTLTGRRRNIADINSNNPNIRSLAQRIAVNTPVQGGSADIIKKAMINVFLKIKDLKFDARMLMQVHDELIFEVKDEIKFEIAQIIAHEMENAFKLNVPMKVEVKAGKNWADMEKISLC